MWFGQEQMVAKCGFFNNDGAGVDGGTYVFLIMMSLPLRGEAQPQKHFHVGSTWRYTPGFTLCHTNPCTVMVNNTTTGRTMELTEKGAPKLNMQSAKKRSQQQCQLLIILCPCKQKVCGPTLPTGDPQLDSSCQSCGHSSHT
jgi:hypothetical protein